MDTPPLIDPALSAVPGLRHGFTLRLHGSEPGPGSGRPGEPSALERVLGPEGTEWTRREVDQVHGGTSRLIGPEAPIPTPAPRADALVTAERGELLVIRTADCLPVLVVAELFDEPVAVAAIHAGWRGLVAGVIDSALEMLERLAPTARVRAALGPAIGPCCFEIGPEVAEELAAAAGGGILRPGRGDRSHADLPAAARLLLEAREVLVPAAAPPCTRCQPERFHSHRADGLQAGRMAAFIGLIQE